MPELHLSELQAAEKLVSLHEHAVYFHEIKYDSGLSFGHGSGSGSSTITSIWVGEKRPPKQQKATPTQGASTVDGKSTQAQTQEEICPLDVEMFSMNSEDLEDLDGLFLDLQVIDWISACSSGGAVTSKSSSGLGSSSAGDVGCAGGVANKVPFVIKTSLTATILLMLGLQYLYLILEASHRVYSDYSSPQVALCLP